MKSHLVQCYCEEFVRRFPEKTAVTDGRERLSFQELELFSNRLANCLRDAGNTRQGCIVYCLQRSVNCIVAMLGILKSDAAYVPVDQKIPEERLKKVVEDCSPCAVVCDSSTIGKVTSVLAALGLKIPVVSLSPRQDGYGEDPARLIFREQVSSSAGSRPDCMSGEDDTAYIMYTSGSTGIPKGVMISHRNIHSYIDWAVMYFSIKDHDVILGTAPFYFDMSVFDIYCAFRAGATLCIARESLMLFPHTLLQFMEEERVTIWKGVSSLLMYMVRSGVLGKSRIPDLRVVAYGGEALPVKYLVSWMETFPDKQFYNAYGPTEATGISLCYQITGKPDLKDRIPIGRPCTDTEVYLLDEHDRPVAAGEIGELCIGGVCLSKGYLNDPDKTNHSFVSTSLVAAGKKLYRTGDLAFLRSDGNYEFIARKDNQVKYMGYRIELCEIEYALGCIQAVKDAAVLLAQSEHQDLHELIAVYESEQEIAPSDIVLALQQQLPLYMIPKKYIRAARIPRNDRGKICRTSIHALVLASSVPCEAG